MIKKMIDSENRYFYASLANVCVPNIIYLMINLLSNVSSWNEVLG